jgi:hypothetical protein
LQLRFCGTTPRCAIDCRDPAENRSFWLSKGREFGMRRISTRPLAKIEIEMRLEVFSLVL